MEQKKQETMEEDKYSLMSNIVFACKGAWKWQKSVVFLLILHMIAEGADAYIPLLITKFVIDGIERGASIKEFLMLVIIAAVLQFILHIFRTVANYQDGHRIEYIMNQYQLARVQKIHTMDYEMLESQHMQDMIMRAEDGAGGMHQFYHSLSTFGFHIVKALLACAIIFTASPWMILLVVVFSIGRYLLSDRTKKWIKKHIDNKNVANRRKERYYISVTKDFKYGKDIRLFQMADTLTHRLEQIQTAIYKLTYKGQRRKVLADDVSMTLDLFIQTGIMYAWMVYDVLYKGMSIGNFTLYLGSIKRFGGAVTNVLSDLANLRDTNRRVNDFRTFMEYPETMREEVEFVELPDAKTYTFTFEHVWFRYPGHEEYVVQDINLTIEGGMRLAVVGPNGAGKSTFIKLLCRLYKPTKGKITVNGIDIWNIEQQRYFQLLAPVFQNVESYAATLAQNVSLQSQESTDKALAEACIRKAGLSDKLDTLPHAVDTQMLRFLYEDGIDLSGGEKQKLSLARALYKAAERKGIPSAKVFVLDEPTAALDPLAEYRMYTSFNELIGEHTAVYISHRLSSTRFCHKVVLLEDGQVMEYGTHEELLKQKGRYAQLYQVQAQYYQEQEDVDE